VVPCSIQPLALLYAYTPNWLTVLLDETHAPTDSLHTRTRSALQKTLHRCKSRALHNMISLQD
jgi:hypothetical protein